MAQPYASMDGYPPAAFYFEVRFSGGSDMDAAFLEVSGIESELEYEEVEEGGGFGLKYCLPKSFKNPLLTLKRGIAEKGSPLVSWCEDVLLKFAFPIELKNIEVNLLGFDAALGPVWDFQKWLKFDLKTLKKEVKTLCGWSFQNAYPVKWEIGAFNSMDNKVAIETIQLFYNDLKRIA